MLFINCYWYNDRTTQRKRLNSTQRLFSYRGYRANQLSYRPRSYEFLNVLGKDIYMRFKSFLKLCLVFYDYKTTDKDLQRHKFCAENRT